MIRNRKPKKDKTAHAADNKQAEDSDGSVEDGEQIKKPEKIAVPIEEKTKTPEKAKSESDDAVEDWEAADIDDIAEKMKNKEVVIPIDEEEKEVAVEKKDGKKGSGNAGAAGKKKGAK